MRVKNCYKCKTKKTVDCFNKNKSKPDGLKSECKECQKAINKVINKFIPDDRWQKLYNKQHGLCAICKKQTKKLKVDHCHKTCLVRGLLCNKCNLGIGFFNDSITLLEQAIVYLKQPKEFSAIGLLPDRYINKTRKH